MADFVRDTLSWAEVQTPEFHCREGEERRKTPLTFAAAHVKCHKVQEDLCSSSEHPLQHSAAEWHLGKLCLLKGSEQFKESLGKELSDSGTGLNSFSSFTAYLLRTLQEKTSC